MAFPIDSVHRPYNSVGTTVPHCDILDVILASNASIVSCVRTDMPLGTSDHVTILFSIALDDLGLGSHNWMSADYDAIELYLSRIDWYKLVAMYPSASDLWEVFMSILYNAVDLYFPQRPPLNTTAHRKPYLRSTRELRKCLVKKHRLWWKLENNKHNVVAIRFQYRECVEQWRHLIQQQQEQTEEHLTEANSIGSFYKFVNRPVWASPPLTNNNDKLITDDCSMNILPV